MRVNDLPIRNVHLLIYMPLQFFIRQVGRLQPRLRLKVPAQRGIRSIALEGDHDLVPTFIAGGQMTVGDKEFRGRKRPLEVARQLIGR